MSNDFIIKVLYNGKLILRKVLYTLKERVSLELEFFLIKPEIILTGSNDWNDKIM